MRHVGFWEPFNTAITTNMGRKAVIEAEKPNASFGPKSGRRVSSAKRQLRSFS